MAFLNRSQNFRSGAKSGMRQSFERLIQLDESKVSGRFENPQRANNGKAQALGYLSNRCVVYQHGISVDFVRKRNRFSLAETEGI